MYSPSAASHFIKAEAGYVLTVRPMRYAHRLQEEPEGGGRGRYWCFDTGEAAILAARAWRVGSESEPVGWLWKGGAR
jgi:hypothetical protein